VKHYEFMYVINVKETVAVEGDTVEGAKLSANELMLKHLNDIVIDKLDDYVVDAYVVVKKRLKK